VGTELGQDPAAGKRIRKNATVTVTYSKGPDLRQVPDLQGKDPGAATAQLKALGLTSSQLGDYSSSVDIGKVIRTDPPAGKKLPPGTSVTLFVSKGPQPVPVPDVHGQTQAQATLALKRLGFTVTFTTTFSDSVAKGIVISNNPHDGTAAKGSTDALTVSKGPEFVNVPNLQYDTTSDATRQLRALGLVVAVRQQVRGGNGQLVLDTDPRAGTRVRVGTTVTLLVY
jgi:serine/threonine-protein kinase